MRFAIIIPWFGAELKGGAEQQAWQLAKRLTSRGHDVRVLTTCSKTFMEDWGRNYYTPGLYSEDGIAIQRFLVDPRNTDRFDQCVHRLHTTPHEQLKPGVPPTPDAHVWIEENINSRDLIEYLQQHQGDFDAVIALPYLYGVVVRSCEAIRQKMWLQPCLHDEWYAYIREVQVAFHHSGKILFNSRGESEIAAKLYGPGVAAKSIVIGEGIEFESLDSMSTEDQIAQALPVSLHDKRFLLCLGRRDASKNVDFLVEAFRQFVAHNPQSNLWLALAGPGDQSYDSQNDRVVDLGLVSAEQKAALLKRMTALAQPSIHESFSRVMFEAWRCEKPVLVHADCLATALATQDAKGGWLAGCSEQWVAHFSHIDSTNAAEECLRLGKQGFAYCSDFADWDRVISRYERLVETSNAAVKSIPAITQRDLELIQVSAGFGHGDAISEWMRFVARHAKDIGFRTRNIACYADMSMPDIEKFGQHVPVDADALMIYHHSIGSEVTPLAVGHRGPKALNYHNITPAPYFQPYRAFVADQLRDGRKELPTLASHFPVSFGVSAYNSLELESAGFINPFVVPISVEMRKWDQLADPHVSLAMSDGAHNLVFVGRYSPNKCQPHLVTIFEEYVKFHPHSRLIIIGGGDPAHDLYTRYLYHRAGVSPARDRIVLTNHIGVAEMLAYYKTASAFVSASEHEGFCVPLIESMWFDVPIVALASSAIPETLGGVGLTFDHKLSPARIASLIHQLNINSNFRARTLAAQRERRKAFSAEAIKPMLTRLLMNMAGVGYEPRDLLFA